MRMYSGTTPGAGRGLPFTIVDIDEQTYRSWEEPLVIPRDRLAGLIRFAVERSPAVVVVHVDLSRRSGPGDAVLERYLAGLGPGLHAVGLASGPAIGSARSPILLARTFREALPPKQGYERRPSFLDGITAGIPSIHWAAPLFEISEDLVVRRWRLIETVCADNRMERRRRRARRSSRARRAGHRNPAPGGAGAAGRQTSGSSSDPGAGRAAWGRFQGDG